MQPDLDLGVVEIVLLASGANRCSITLTQAPAIDLALHIIAAVGKLRGWRSVP